MTADRRRFRVAVAIALVATCSTVVPATAHGGAEGYRWVGEAGDDAPLRRTADLQPGVPTDLWTPDAQAVLSLPAGALVPPTSGTTVPVRLEPVALELLGELPEGLLAAGNAYRVDIPMAAPGRIVLSAAHPATGVLHSADGRTWQPVEHEPSGQGTVDAPLAAPGWYLPVTAVGHVRRPPLALLAVGAVLLLAGGVREARSRRR